MLYDQYKGYQIEELRTVFGKVHDPADWKAPIAVWTRGEDVSVIVAAIEFMTATNPVVKLDSNTMRYYVTSEGYRNGPAGDN